MNASEVVDRINSVDVLAAGIEENDGETHSGLIYIQHLKPNNRECVAWQVEMLLPRDVKKLVELVDSEDSSSIVWAKVK